MRALQATKKGLHHAANLPDGPHASLVGDVSSSMITALEDAVFSESEGGQLQVDSPSVALTGWVTARMLAEAAAASSTKGVDREDGYAM